MKTCTDLLNEKGQVMIDSVKEGIVSSSIEKLLMLLIILMHGGCNVKWVYKVPMLMSRRSSENHG
jgi:hypothetical protein